MCFNVIFNENKTVFAEFIASSWHYRLSLLIVTSNIVIFFLLSSANVVVATAIAEKFVFQR